MDVAVVYDSCGAAEDEWVVDVGGVELDGSVDGGYAHAVAVVADSSDDSAHDAEWVDDVVAFDFFWWGVWCAEAEDV